MKVPWGHHRILMDKCKGDTRMAIFYVQYNANIRNEFLYCEDVRVLVEKGGKDVISRVIAHLEAEAEKTGDKDKQKQLEKIDTALSPFAGRTRHERLEGLCNALSDAAKSGCPHPIPNAVRVLWRHTEMGGYYDRHSPYYMEAVHEGSGKLNPMLMINLLAWKDAHDSDLPFVAAARGASPRRAFRATPNRTLQGVPSCRASENMR